MTKRLVGVSLHKCVSDIAMGRVQIGDVKEIISDAKVTSPAGWDYIIQKYQTQYWSDYPEQAAAIARTLIKEGKIKQPRLEDPHALTHWVDLGHYQEPPPIRDSIAETIYHMRMQRFQGGGTPKTPPRT